MSSPPNCFSNWPAISGTLWLTGLWLLAPAAVLAATNPAGVWEGALKGPAGELGIVFNLHRDGDRWAAEMDFAAQGVSGLPLPNVRVDGAAIGLSSPVLGTRTTPASSPRMAKASPAPSHKAAYRFRWT